jgi:hypothetical protein
MRKLNYCSSYERFFGRYVEVSRGECEILKYKKFSELPIVSILNPMATSYLENWTLLGEDDKYLNLCLHTIRSIYTYLKNLKPKITNYTETYRQAKKHEIMSPSRFDTIEKQVKKMTHKNLYNSKYNEMMREYTA